MRGESGLDENNILEELRIRIQKLKGSREICGPAIRVQLVLNLN